MKKLLIVVVAMSLTQFAVAQPKMQYSSAMAASPAIRVNASARHTGFVPSRHGFKFVNNFQNDVVKEVDIRTAGLCGGMVYAALDYFNKRMAIPSQTYSPAVGTPLHDYIYNREVQSLVPNLSKWAESGFNPGGARNSEFFHWGLQGYGGGRLQELRAAIDHGRPVPLGLQSYGGEGRPGNHQVLAIGYDMGRYKGDLKAYQGDLKIYVYDPNYPNVTRTLVPDLRHAGYVYRDGGSPKMWRAYFVDTNYSVKTPPQATSGQRTSHDGKVHSLRLRIRTGGDDLRGGNDNLNIEIYCRNGHVERLPNVNQGRRWIDNNEQVIVLNLSRPVALDQIKRITLVTTFSGGVGGDNWNMDKLAIRAMGGDVNELLYDESGSPLFRFTGDHKRFTSYTR